MMGKPGMMPEEIEERGKQMRKDRKKDILIAAVIVVAVVAFDLYDGKLQWRMDAGVLFLVLLIVFWMRSLAHTRKIRQDIYNGTMLQQKEKEQ